MELLKAYALQFVGVPYMWGGSNPITGYDCSGLVQELLASCGIDPPGDQTAQGLYDHFSIVGTREKGCGALAFYGKEKAIVHVGMMLDDYRIIEAGGGGSKTTSLQAAETQNAYVRIRHLHARLDLFAVIMPKYQV